MSCLNSHFSRDVIILVYVRLALLSPVLVPGVSLEDRHATGYSDGCSAREGAHAPALADYRESARDGSGRLSHFTCVQSAPYPPLSTLAPSARRVLERRSGLCAVGRPLQVLPLRPVSCLRVSVVCSCAVNDPRSQTEGASAVRDDRPGSAGPWADSLELTCRPPGRLRMQRKRAHPSRRRFQSIEFGILRLHRPRYRSPDRACAATATPAPAPAP